MSHNPLEVGTIPLLYDLLLEHVLCVPILDANFLFIEMITRYCVPGDFTA